MARLAQPPKNANPPKSMQDRDNILKAIEWLRENPEEKIVTAARIFGIKNEKYFCNAWGREKAKRKRGQVAHGGHNRILDDDQHQALIQYSIDQATNGGLGATKRMVYNAACYLRKEAGKGEPSWRWLQGWLRDTKELHTIKTKPIPRHRTDMHTEQDLRDWFEKEYVPALEHTGIRSGEFIHNMDEKGCRIACPSGEEVVVPLGISEMYVGIPENRVSLTVIESICANGTAMPPVVIVPGATIMESWFHEV